jgi:hypothetical protein
MTQGPHSELVQDAALVLRAVHVAEGLAGRTDSVQRWNALELWTVVYHASHNQRGVGSPVTVAFSRRSLNSTRNLDGHTAQCVTATQGKDSDHARGPTWAWPLSHC